jgi:23S rRNA A2030 N6-methylase RlmJ
MANRHYGNWGDIFKHVGLAEVLALLRPGEYWESHAGAARYAWGDGPAEGERAHGIGFFVANYERLPGLRLSAYGRLLEGIVQDRKPAFVPGSPWLAMKTLGAEARRYLFCDTEAESLQSVAQAAAELGVAPGQIECIPEDGAMIVRGACMVLVENWTRSTLAVIDPYDALAPTAAEVHSLGLWCELASRGIPSMLWYGFKDAAQGERLREEFAGAVEKARLGRNGVQRFEAALRDGPSAAGLLLGCGLLTANLPEVPLAAMHERYRALGELYTQAPGGAIKYAGRAG